MGAPARRTLAGNTCRVILARLKAGVANVVLIMEMESGRFFWVMLERRAGAITVEGTADLAALGFAGVDALFWWGMGLLA